MTKATRKEEFDNIINEMPLTFIDDMAVLALIGTIGILSDELMGRFNSDRLVIVGAIEAITAKIRTVQ